MLVVTPYAEQMSISFLLSYRIQFLRFTKPIQCFSGRRTLFPFLADFDITPLSG